MPVAVDIIIVIATIVSAFSLTSVISGWVVRQWPIIGMISLAIGLGLFAYVHLTLPDGLTPRDIPDSFILVAARILN